MWTFLNKSGLFWSILPTLNILGSYELPKRNLLAISQCFSKIYWWSWSAKTVNSYTAWEMSKHRVFSGPYFLIFGLNTRKYGPQKTPYLDTFLTVLKTINLVESCIISNKVLNKHKGNNSTNPWTATSFTKGSWVLALNFWALNITLFVIFWKSVMTIYGVTEH